VNLQLLRDHAGPDATLGRLTVREGLILETLELPWRADPVLPCGLPRESCLPEGHYELALHDSALHPRTFCLVSRELGVYHMPSDIPQECGGRTCCLIHVANFTSELEGCIGVGRDRRLLAERWMITDSREAYAAFQAAVPWIEGHTLTIAYAAGVHP
jgi:hypothetical protein